MTFQEFDPVSRFVVGTVGPPGNRPSTSRPATAGASSRWPSRSSRFRSWPTASTTCWTSCADDGHRAGAARRCARGQRSARDAVRGGLARPDPVPGLGRGASASRHRVPRPRPGRARGGRGGRGPRGRWRRGAEGHASRRNSLKVTLDPPQARAFARRSLSLVAAGRPLPLLRWPARPDGPHLPAGQWLPSLTATSARRPRSTLR